MVRPKTPFIFSTRECISIDNHKVHLHKLITSIYEFTINLSHRYTVISSDPHSVAYRGGWFGGFKPPRNSKDISGVLDHMSKNNQRLDFLLWFTVFSYGCNLLNKGFF